MARARSNPSGNETTFSLGDFSTMRENGLDADYFSASTVGGMAQLDAVLRILDSAKSDKDRLDDVLARIAERDDSGEAFDRLARTIERDLPQIDEIAKGVAAGNVTDEAANDAIRSRMESVVWALDLFADADRERMELSQQQLDALNDMRSLAVSAEQRDSERHDEMVSSINAQSKAISNAMTNMNSIVSSVMSGNVGGAVSGTKGLMKDLGDIADDMMSGSAEGSLGSIVGGRLSGVLSKAAAPLAVASGVMMGVGALEKGADVLMNARDVSLNQTGEGGNFGISARMGFESQMVQALTNLDANQVRSVQNALVSNRALYGSEEYEQGMDFAVSASQTRGMDAAKAAQLYANAVVKGTMSVDQLNAALDNLQETVKGTDITMDEAVRELNNAIETMTKSYGGGNESYGTELGIGLESLAGGDQLSMLQGVAGLYSTDDAYVNQQIADYQQQNGVDYATATAAVSMQLLQSGYGVGGASDPLRKLNTLPIDQSGKRFWDYYTSGDAEGFQEAVNNLKMGNISSAMLPYGTFLQAMKKMGIPDAIANDPKTLTDFLFGEEVDGERSGGMTDVYSEENQQSATAKNIGDYENVGAAIESGLMTEEDAASLTEEQLGSLNESLGKNSKDDGSWLLRGDEKMLVSGDRVKRRAIDKALKSASKDDYDDGAVMSSEQKGNQMVLTIKLADGAEKYITYAVNDENDQITADSGR